MKRYYQNTLLDEMIKSANEKKNWDKFSYGELSVLNNYQFSHKDYPQMVGQDVNWINDSEGMIKLMRKAGISKFILAAGNSSELMRAIHEFWNAGFKITGIIELSKNNPDEYGDKPLKGIVFERGNTE